MASPNFKKVKIDPCDLIKMTKVKLEDNLDIPLELEGQYLADLQQFKALWTGLSSVQDYHNRLEKFDKE